MQRIADLVQRRRADHYHRPAMDLALRAEAGQQPAGGRPGRDLRPPDVHSREPGQPGVPLPCSASRELGARERSLCQDVGTPRLDRATPKRALGASGHDRGDVVDSRHGSPARALTLRGLPVMVGMCLVLAALPVPAEAFRPVPARSIDATNRPPGSGSPATRAESTGLEIPDLIPGTLMSDDDPIRTYDAPCKDLVLVGARGSGEPSEDGSGEPNEDSHGLGKPVDAFRAELVAAFETTLLPVDIAFGYIPVLYPAQPTEALWSGQVDAYFDGLAQGIEQSLRWLVERHAACPGERYLLAGYSQGAMVMHRLIWVLSQDKYRSVRRAVVGGVAIADGDRWFRQSGRDYGSRTTRSWLDRGIAMIVPSGPGFRGAHRQRLPEWIEYDWYSVCDRRDIVCDPLRALELDRADVPSDLRWRGVVRWLHRKARLAQAGSDLHESHYRPGSGVRHAAEVASRVVRKYLPNPIETTHLPQPVAGVPYAAQLMVVPGRTGRWSLASGSLPAGLRVEPGGNISGTPTNTCSWCVATFKLQDDFNHTSYYATLPMFTGCAGLERDLGGDAVAQLAALAVNNLDATFMDGCASSLVIDRFRAFLRRTGEFIHPVLTPAPCEMEALYAIFHCPAATYDGGTELDFVFSGGSAGFLFEGISGHF